MSEAFLEALSIAFRLKKVSLTVQPEAKFLPGALFASVTFGKSGKDSVGQGELGEILGNIVLIFIGVEGGCKIIRTPFRP